MGRGCARLAASAPTCCNCTCRETWLKWWSRHVLGVMIQWFSITTAASGSCTLQPGWMAGKPPPVVCCVLCGQPARALPLIRFMLTLSADAATLASPAGTSSLPPGNRSTTCPSPCMCLVAVPTAPSRRHRPLQRNAAPAVGVIVPVTTARSVDGRCGVQVRAAEAGARRRCGACGASAGGAGGESGLRRRGGAARGDCGHCGYRRRHRRRARAAGAVPSQSALLRLSTYCGPHVIHRRRKDAAADSACWLCQDRKIIHSVGVAGVRGNCLIVRYSAGLAMSVSCMELGRMQPRPVATSVRR